VLDRKFTINAEALARTLMNDGLIGLVKNSLGFVVLPDVVKQDGKTDCGVSVVRVDAQRGAEVLDSGAEFPFEVMGDSPQVVRIGASGFGSETLLNHSVRIGKLPIRKRSLNFDIRPKLVHCLGRTSGKRSEAWVLSGVSPYWSSIF
jgi:hypothetical protein